jgi:hypothetical protein
MDKGTWCSRASSSWVQGLQARSQFTFVIDGQEVGIATTDQRGSAEVELKVKIP